MPAVDAKKLSKYVGQLYVDPVGTPVPNTRLASVRGLTAVIDNTVNTIEILADDTGTILKGSTKEFRIEGSFLENVDRDVIHMLFGGTSTNTAGTPVVGETMLIASGDWGYNAPITIDEQNGDGTPLAVTTVTGSVDGLLVSGTDYILTQIDGKTAIMFLAGGAITTLTQAISIVYDYTPNASENLVMSARFMEDPALAVRIVAMDDTGKTITVLMNNATFEGQYNLQFLDLQQAGDLEGTTFTFKGARGSDMSIVNEII